MKDFVQYTRRSSHYDASIANNSWQGRLLRPLCSLVVVLMVFAAGIGLLLSVGAVKAAGTSATLFQTSATPPAAQPSQQAAPNVPNAVNTGAPSVPNAASSAVPGSTRTTNNNSTSDSNSTPNPITGVAPGIGAAPGTSAPPVAPAGSSNSFPWWAPVLIAALLVIFAVFFLMRNRQQRNVVTVGPAVAPRTVAIPATTTTTAVSAVPTAATVANTATVAPLTAAPASIGASVTCPNCGTLNGPHENFCHECGQDLRPLHAAAASAPPNEPVDEYTPYLETLSRVDEQLEYVLARPRVTVGSAANNDIVIDPTFVGNATVAPVQAELRRQDGVFTLVDIGGENNTFVNGSATGEQGLADGDQIRLGEVGFVYHAPARPQ